MIDNAIVLKDFDQTFSALTNAIAVFDPENFNEIPFENSWTAGQVVQHLILANSGFAQVLAADVKDTLRAADELIANIKSDFLNFEINMKSPDFILPAFKIYDRNELLTQLAEIRKSITEKIGTLDLSKTCLAFELPVYGHLTRLEAIYFVIYHTQRHTRQLGKIYKRLKLS